MSHDQTEIMKAKQLTAAVEFQLRNLVETLSKGIDIPEKFVWAEIAYLATQSARQAR